MTSSDLFAKLQKVASVWRRILSILASQGPRILWVKLANRWRRIDYKHVFESSLRQSEPLTAAGEQEHGDAPLLFSIIVPLYNTQPDHLAAMIASVQAQTYPHWQLCLADGSDQDRVEAQVSRLVAQDNRITYQRLAQNLGISGNTNAALAMASGDFIALLDHDDLLAPQALAAVHKAIVSQGADLIYSDEMNFAGDISQVSLIHFKPDFALDNLRSNNYICHLTVFARALSEQIGSFDPACDGSQDYDYILRLSEQAQKIVHIPQILYYWRIHGGSVASDISAKPYCLDAARLALANHLQRTGQTGQAGSAGEVGQIGEVSRADQSGQIGQVENNSILSTYRIRYPLPQDWRALVFVHIRDPRDLRQLQRFDPSIAGASTRWVFLVPAGFLVKPEDQASFEKALVTSGLDGTLVSVQSGESISGRINQIAHVAVEPLLVFLSGTVQSLSPGWLEELAQQALRPDIGLATVKITRRGLICQAGLATGISGSLSGYHAGQVDGEPGYMARLSFVNNISAAEQTLMAVSRTHFLAVGGFDERYQTDLFDLDLAFRLSQQGLRHVFTPYATAAIRDSRQQTVERLARHLGNPADHDHFQSLWQKTIAQPDPYYNPNFNQNHARFDQR